jgi:hypothetical protein
MQSAAVGKLLLLFLSVEAAAGGGAEQQLVFKYSGMRCRR